MFALSAPNFMDNEVHQLVMLLATVLGILSFAAFFHLIDYASRLLRRSAFWPMSAPPRDSYVTESIYPEAGHGTDIEEGETINLGPPGRVFHTRERRPLW